VREYDIFVPLNYNDGTPIEPRKLRRIQSRLLEHFDGLTFFPQPNEGFWRMGGVTYRDEIVIYRVFSGHRRAARQFLSRFKDELKADLQQEEILIIERDVETL
jgi:molybdopterin synthase catalytic subunit